MKKFLKITAIVLVIVFLGIQFVRPDFTNEPVVPAESIETAADVPPEVKAVLARSCADCHSNETAHPWYSRISPVSWWLAGHIRDGREEFNFSKWNTYEAKRKVKKATEVCEQVEAKEMPLPSYTWAHRDAVLSADEIRLLCDWSAAVQGVASGQKSVEN